MLRTFIRPASPEVTILLPDEMVGKTIEVIAFEIEEEKPVEKASTFEERLKKIQAITASCRIDLSKRTSF